MFDGGSRGHLGDFLMDILVPFQTRLWESRERGGTTGQRELLTSFEMVNRFSQVDQI